MKTLVIGDPITKSISKYLPLLSNLKTLDISKSYTVPEEGESLELIQTLATVKHITHLSFSLRWLKAWGSEGISYLTHLESLDLCNGEAVEWGPFDFSEFKKLTKFSCSVISEMSLRFTWYTTLQELDLCVSDTSEETIQRLALLINLRRVSINVNRKISSRVIEGWKELRSLTIPVADVDNDFFSTLAKLPNLHYLELEKRYKDVVVEEKVLSEIRFLTSLEILVFDTFGLDPLTLMPEGSFPRLRRICIGDWPFSDDTKKELFRRLPYLVKLELVDYSRLR